METDGVLQQIKSLCSSQWLIVGEEVIRVGKIMFSGVVITPDDRIVGAYPTEEWSMERLKLVCFLCQPAVFFRRRIIERFGPFDARLNYCMDYEYWLRLGLRGARFVHIPTRLAAIRS